VLFLRKYENASTWLHKFRRPIVRPGRDLLTGRAGFVHTDGWRGYNGTTAQGCVHEVSVIRKEQTDDIGTAAPRVTSSFRS